MLFQSNREFRIWAYTCSHSSLLLRSEMKYPDQDYYREDEAFNIDIELWSVSFVGIPSRLNGITIEEIPFSALPENINKHSLESYQKILAFKSEEFTYYIIASGFIIGTNKWVDENRIFNFHQNLKHDKILIEYK